MAIPLSKTLNTNVWFIGISAGTLVTIFLTINMESDQRIKRGCNGSGGARRILSHVLSQSETHNL